MRDLLSPAPKRIAELADRGLMFACRGCARRRAIGPDECATRWGQETRIDALARRFRCLNCGRRGADVRAVSPRVFEHKPMVTRDDAELVALVAAIDAIKPRGLIS